MIITIGFKFAPSYFSYLFSAPLNLMNNIETFFTDFSSNREDIESLRLENQDLIEENSKLTVENQRLSNLEKENKALSDLLKTSESYPDYNKLVCRVIGKDISNWYDRFIINKGEKDGIKDNMVVITSGGLVGHVSKTYESYAEVKSIIDDTSSVSSILPRTGTLGFVNGDNTLIKDDRIKMEFFDIDSEALIGDEVTTSHLSSLYPREIKIGEIQEIYEGESGLRKYALIKPYVNFNDIQTVIVFLEDFDTGIDSLEE